MPYFFCGGIYADQHKKETSLKPIFEPEAPKIVKIPVNMGVGQNCRPIVKVGDSVKIGDRIADGSSRLCVAVHSSISGVVSEISEMPVVQGSSLCIVIKNDFKNTCADFSPFDWKDMSSNEICSHIREGGIIGMGGAGFPSHYKIQSSMGKAETLIVNCVECEPFLTSDHLILKERFWQIIGGIPIILKAVKASKAIIAVAKNKSDVFPAIQREISNRRDISLMPLPSKYPQGSEKQLIYAVSGKEIPSGGLPSDVGFIVFNADTVCSIYRLFSTGAPLTTRIVTVSGSAISNPKNYETPIGTLAEHLIKQAGSFRRAPAKIIIGGPMTGTDISDLGVPITKTSSGIIAVTDEEFTDEEQGQCIRCGRCVRACPMGLMPLYMNIYAEKYDLNRCMQLGVMDCIECGCCSYECPARLRLSQNFSRTKILVRNKLKQLSSPEVK